jgi:multidrug efflux pump subunit AcrA (membrane-fusion protein)
MRRGGALRVALVAGLVVALAGGGLVWWGGAVRAGDNARRVGLDLSDAEKMTFDITTAASGELEAKNQIEIRNKLETPSTISEVVAEGTRVKTGDLLVRLNVDAIEQLLDQAKVEIENMKAQLEAAQHAYDIQLIENEQKLRQAQLKVELAELDRLQWLEGEAKTKRQANSLALSKSLLEVERLAEKLRQSSGLLEKGFLSKDEYDRDQVAYIEAQSAWITSTLENEVFEEYEFRKQEKKFQSDYEEAKAELEQVRLNNSIQLAAKTADRAAKKRVYDLQDEQVKKHEAAILNATIKAPSDGLVVYASSMSRNMWSSGDGPIAIGREVMPNETMMMLPDTSEMVATVRVPETLASRISKGQLASIKVDAAGGRTFQGVVDSIGVLAESGGWRDPNLKEYTVKIAIDRAQAEGLKPSMRCEARIFLDRVTDGTSVPVQAVFSDGPVRFVHVREGSRFVRRPVNLGRQSDTHAEILAGLEPGTQVLNREPTPAEFLTRDWDKGQLETAGYQIGEDGKPMRRERRGRGPATAQKASGAATTAKVETKGATEDGSSDVQPAGTTTVVVPATSSAASSTDSVVTTK